MSLHVPKQVRNICFTINNPELTPTALEEAVRNAFAYSYLVFQLEKGEQGTPHYQGYVEFPGPKAFTRVHRVLCNGHLESRRGTAKQASDYCKKADSRLDGPWEFGQLSQQGARSDIGAAIDALREGGMSAALERYPETVARYRSGLSFVDVELHKFDRRDPPEVTLLYGPPGCGKTRFAFDSEPRLVSVSGSLKWYDGYNGEEAVLFDDFDGKFSAAPLKQLLLVLDRYPLRVEVKGGHVNFVAKRIYITTNIHPTKWYDWSEREAQFGALRRRFTRVLWWPTPEPDTRRDVSPGTELWTRFWAGPVSPPLTPLGPLDNYVVHPDPIDNFNF